MSDCIEYSGATNGRYGVKWRHGKLHMAHRLAFEDATGIDPSGYDVRHKCHNTRCVNPDHLELGSHKENMVDMVRAGRQHKRLTDDQVLSIRELYTAGGVTQKELAAKFGTSQGHVSSILSKRKRPVLTNDCQ